jgi:uncharacterized protein (TIGR03067 family)
MRTRTVVVFLGLAVSTSATGTPLQERAALDGTWLVTSLSLNGQTRGTDGAQLAVTITGDKYEQSLNGEVDERGTIKVDPTKKPMTIDFIISEGVAQNTTQLGIVEVTGDTVKFYLNAPGATVRPADFTPLADHLLIIAKRK